MGIVWNDLHRTHCFDWRGRETGTEFVHGRQMLVTSRVSINFLMNFDVSYWKVLMKMTNKSFYTATILLFFLQNYPT